MVPNIKFRAERLQYLESACKKCRKSLYEGFWHIVKTCFKRVRKLGAKWQIQISQQYLSIADTLYSGHLVYSGQKHFLEQRKMLFIADNLL